MDLVATTTTTTSRFGAPVAASFGVSTCCLILHIVICCLTVYGWLYSQPAQSFDINRNRLISKFDNQWLRENFVTFITVGFNRFLSIIVNCHRFSRAVSQVDQLILRLVTTTCDYGLVNVFINLYSVMHVARYHDNQ